MTAAFFGDDAEEMARYFLAECPVASAKMDGKILYGFVFADTHGARKFRCRLFQIVQFFVHPVEVAREPSAA